MSMRPEVLLVDSGFFFALFDPKDSQSKDAARWTHPARRNARSATQAAP